MSWLRDRAPVIEAIAACITALAAVSALIGIKFQLDAADTLQRQAAARDTYRTHLALAVANPEYARPSDGCAILASDAAGSYVAFTDHLLYSAEQMLTVERGWEATFLAQLASHQDYLCSEFSPGGDTPEISALLDQFRSQQCPAEPAC